MERRLPGPVALLVGAGLACAPVRSAAAAVVVAEPTARTVCRNVEVPIRLGTQGGTQSGAPDGAIAGTLCVPPGARTLQLLVAGNTYNRSYWQSDVEPATYGYVRRANSAGYATLAVDRLGTGSSLRPPSGEMTFGNDVSTMHDVVTAVRAGVFGPFDRVVGVGHSLGSIVVDELAGEHPNDLDALVLTGFSHSINIVNAAGRVATRYAATADADPFYITAQPGGRDGFYAASAVAPEILAWDDRTRDTANLVEMAGFAHFQVPNASRGISAPVFVVNGAADPVACGAGSGDCATGEALRDSERPWFGPHADVAAWTVPGLGHAVTLHRNAAVVNATITAWIDDAVGAGPGVLGSAPGVIPATGAVPVGTTEPAVLATNRALLAVTPGLAEAYGAAVGPVPGLGDGDNPAPAYNALLLLVANMVGPAGR